MGLYWYLYLSETESWLFSISASVCLLFCLFFLLWKLDLEIEILFAVWILSLVGMGVFQCLYFYASFFFFFSLCLLCISIWGWSLHLYVRTSRNTINSQPTPTFLNFIIYWACEFQDLFQCQLSTAHWYNLLLYMLIYLNKK